MHVSGVFGYLLVHSCSAASSVKHEHSRWEGVRCGSDGMGENAVRALIASYSDTLYDYRVVLPTTPRVTLSGVTRITPGNSG